MTEKRRIEVVIFSGGSGTASIIKALLKSPQLSIHCIVNAYDDGLSTGALRKFIPGMLGPSDIRKNIARLIHTQDRSGAALKNLLEHRFPDEYSREGAQAELRCFAEQLDPKDVELRSHFVNLTIQQVRALAAYSRLFLEYAEKKAREGSLFHYSGCSLGNLFFAGAYLEQGQDFNRTIETFSRLAPLQGDVVNITDGQNRILVGIDNMGRILKNEAEIVGPGATRDDSEIREVFLLPDYLTESQLADLDKLSIEERIAYLRRFEKVLPFNPAARDLIRSADLIIYGPGTQNSSLFPSYLTQGLSESIKRNERAPKIFVSNVRRDNDIKGEDVHSLLNKFSFYMNHKAGTEIPDQSTVTHFFIQRAPQPETDVLTLNPEKLGSAISRIRWIDWEGNPGHHSASVVSEEILSIIQERVVRDLQYFHHSVSIVVPALNEAKTIAKVLHDLTLVNLLSLDLEKEIIMVDGGSTDQTVALARQVPGIKVFELPKGSGRGDALRHGISKAKGNLIVFFPSDGEYSTKDLFRLIQPILMGEAEVVLGSRALKCVNIGKRARDIYQESRLLSLFSKYGGGLLSFLMLIFYNRYVCDPLTSLKAFTSRSIRGVEFKCRGFDFDLELLAMLSLQAKFISEVPVDYVPRTRAQGKKITVLDGLKCMLALTRFRKSLPPALPKPGGQTHEDALNHYTSL